MRGFSVYNVVALGFLHIRTALAQTAEFDVFSVVPNITIEAGTKFDIRWYPSPAPLDGPITISLIHGNQGSLTAPATVLGSTWALFYFRAHTIQSAASVRDIITSSKF